MIDFIIKNIPSFKLKERLKNGTISFSAFVLLIIVAFIIAIIIVPFFNFWFGYFSGWIAKLLFGKYLVKGFSLLGITIPLNSIPLLGGILAWVGSFFKSSSASINKEG